MILLWLSSAIAVRAISDKTTANVVNCSLSITSVAKRSGSTRTMVVDFYKLEVAVDIDEEKIDDAALALLFLTLHDHFCAWKQIDWEVTNRLYEKGLIANPRGKQKSIVFTDKGLSKAKHLFKQMFTKS